MKRSVLFTTLLTAALLLSACGGREASPDSIAAEKAANSSGADAKPTNTPAPTQISPEELAKRSAESSGYGMKVLGVEDPGKAEAGYTPAPNTRLVAVKLEFTNLTSDDKLLVELTNATITDDKGVDYPAIQSAHSDEVKSGELAKGEKSVGWVGFTVPADVKVKSVTYRVGLISIVALSVDLP